MFVPIPGLVAENPRCVRMPELLNRRAFTAVAGLCLAETLIRPSAVDALPRRSPADDSLWVRPGEGSEPETLPDGSIGRISEYRGCDGNFIPAYMRTPKGRGPFPVVLVQHGGAPSEDATYTTGRSSPPAQAFAQAGWAVFATDFRHLALPGGSVIEWHDGVAAVEALRNLSYIDRRRIAIMAGSHGAHVYSEVVVRTTVRGAVLCSPAIFDLIELAKAHAQGIPEVAPIIGAITAGEKRYGATIDEVAVHPECYGYDSPLTEAAQTRCPILIINGRNDTSSPVVVMETYRDRLRAAGKTVETYFPDNAPHGFYFGVSHPPRPEETAEAAKRATAFIRKHFA
jgi:dipeptidyl aminopeptidase/acylaminoacyl peptidase